MEQDKYRSFQEEIIYCRDLAGLNYIVQRIIGPTGFGANALGEPGIDVQLDFQEISDCLAETDRKFFQYEIELLIQAEQQTQQIKTGQVPDKQETIQPWQMFT